MDLILNRSKDAEVSDTHEPSKPILSEHEKIEAFRAQGQFVLVASGIFFGRAVYLVSSHDSKEDADAAYVALDLKAASEDGIAIDIRSPR